MLKNNPGRFCLGRASFFIFYAKNIVRFDFFHYLCSAEQHSGKFAGDFFRYHRLYGCGFGNDHRVTMLTQQTLSERFFAKNIDYGKFI